LVRRLELVTKWLVGLTITLALLVVAVGWLAIELLTHR
jgi:cell division septal protein FtsQ